MSEIVAIVALSSVAIIGIVLGVVLHVQIRGARNLRRLTAYIEETVRNRHEVEQEIIRSLRESSSRRASADLFLGLLTKHGDLRYASLVREGLTVDQILRGMEKVSGERAQQVPPEAPTSRA